MMRLSADGNISLAKLAKLPTSDPEEARALPTGHTESENLSSLSISTTSCLKIQTVPLTCCLAPLNSTRTPSSGPLGGHQGRAVSCWPHPAALRPAHLQTQRVLRPGLARLTPAGPQLPVPAGNQPRGGAEGQLQL